MALGAARDAGRWSRFRTNSLAQFPSDMLKRTGDSSPPVAAEVEPMCPWCKSKLALADVKAVRQSGVRWTNINFVYCGKCGAILGGAAQV